MKVIFRVDASNRMGTGHLMRCLTLAEALCERGAHIRFVCRAHPGNLIELLERQAMPVMVLPEYEQPIREKHTDDYAACLGVTKTEDADQTIKALQGDRPDWLIVDHYGLDAEWEQMLRPHVSKLMVIDNHANRLHDCDFLLDQNFTDGREERHRNLVPENCRLLLGPRYALLRSEYSAYRKTLRPSNGEIRRVLVFFGGSDRHNMTAMALEALSLPEFAHLEVDVVIGANNQHRAALEQQISARPLTNLYTPQPHLADLMVQADLAIGAGGTTTLERMCLGLPSLMVSISENQRPACEALSRAGLIKYLGDVSSVQGKGLANALKEFIGNHDHVLDLSIENQLLVDGLGTLRLAEVLYPTQAEKLLLRPACQDDIDLYFNWANDPEVRRQAIHSEPIAWTRHQEWFTSKFADPQSRLFILMAGSLPVGQIRFDRKGDEARIDYSLDVIVQGRGLGTRLVALGADLMQQIQPIRLRALVKTGNESSISVFVRMGFTEEASALEGYRSFYRDPINSSVADQMQSIEAR